MRSSQTAASAMETPADVAVVVTQCEAVPESVVTRRPVVTEIAVALAVVVGTAVVAG